MLFQVVMHKHKDPAYLANTDYTQLQSERETWERLNSGKIKSQCNDRHPFVNIVDYAPLASVMSVRFDFDSFEGYSGPMPCAMPILLHQLRGTASITKSTCVCPCFFIMWIQCWNQTVSFIETVLIMVPASPVDKSSAVWLIALAENWEFFLWRFK